MRILNSFINDVFIIKTNSDSSGSSGSSTVVKKIQYYKHKTRDTIPKYVKTVVTNF